MNRLISSLQADFIPKSNRPVFSIITTHHGLADTTDPLFCCVASVVDQENITLEQIVQHTGGLSGLWNRLARDLNLSKKGAHYGLRILEEKNSSFFDLLQRGLQRAQGRLLGFLKPEEQYLPGALAAVEKEFQIHPQMDVLITGCFVVDPKTNQITPHHTASFSPEYLTTCSPKFFPSTIFFRTTLISEGFTFDATYDEATFAEWLLRILNAGKKVGTLDFFTSVITQPTKEEYSSNFSSGYEKLLQRAPAIMRFLRPWWKLRHQMATKKNKSSAPVHCLRYQLGSLNERKPF
ncbi:MAG: hypothetical protein ACH346_01705 [Chthoniobacterales bacterium]